MADGNSTLQYQPLIPSKFETRFLKYSQVMDDGHLAYSLETGSLIQPLNYVALSYQWYSAGNREKNDSIIIDGTHVPITQSLADALWHLNSHLQAFNQTSRLIWADQICINQCDGDERATQVQQMGKIYAGAGMVYVWLGLASHDSDCAMSACSRAFGQTRFELSGLERDAIANLVRRTYFERAWIIQEFAKARYRTILCGEYAVPWTGLERALGKMEGNLSADSQILMSALVSFRIRERESRLSAPRMLLIQALVDSRRSVATEPRDKIYALLGLTRDGSEVVPVPHYENPDTDVYIGVARHMIVTQGHTASMLLAARTEHRTGLPSWVPNWGSCLLDMPPWIEAAISAPRESIQSNRETGIRDRVVVPGVLLEQITGCADAASLGNPRTFNVDMSSASLEKYRMKLAWSKAGRLRVVHQDSHVGDWVCRLTNSILPVVLRYITDTRFSYVGEVYRNDQSNEFWLDFKKGEIEMARMGEITIV